MLIEIDIKESDLIDEEHDSIFRLFSEISMSSSNGNHRFVIAPELIEWVLNRTDMKIYESQLKNIGRNFPMVYEQINEPVPSLKVVHNNKQKITKISDKKWCIGHSELYDSKFLEETVLVVESYDDSEFYELMLRSVAEKSDFGPINFDLQEGGGSTTYKGLRKYTKRKRVTVCVCDSERLAPGEKDGGTYKKVLKEEKQLTVTLVGKVECTPGHEIENFLSIETIDVVMGKEFKESTEILTKLRDKQGEVESGKCVLLFYDLKDGVTLEKVSKHCISKENKLWSAKSYADFFDQIDPNNIPKYGGSIISKFLENPLAKEKFIHSLDEKYWNLHYSKWVKSLLWYFCGDNKTVTS